jgi:hypothetical protein
MVTWEIGELGVEGVDLVTCPYTHATPRHTRPPTRPVSNASRPRRFTNIIRMCVHGLGLPELQKVHVVAAQATEGSRCADACRPGYVRAWEQRSLPIVLIINPYIASVFHTCAKLFDVPRAKLAFTDMVKPTGSEEPAPGTQGKSHTFGCSDFKQCRRRPSQCATRKFKENPCRAREPARLNLACGVPCAMYEVTSRMG